MNFGFVGPFEAALVHRAITDRRFYGAVGWALSPDALSADSAKLLMTAAHDIFAETNAAPASDIIVLQRLNRYVREGRVSADLVMQCPPFLDLGDAHNEVSNEDLVAEAAPVIRHVAERGLIEQLTSDYVRKGLKYDDIRAKIAQLEQIGATRDSSTGMSSIADLMAATKSRQRMCVTSGNKEQDLLLSGGFPRPGLSMYIGGTNIGKTPALMQVAAANILAGLHVAIASNELDNELVGPLLLSSMANVSRTMLDAGDERALAEAQRRLYTRNLRFSSKFFDATEPWDNYLAWLDAVEKAKGPIDLLVLDYQDRIGVTTGDGSGGEYMQGRIVTEQLRSWGLSRKAAVVTASQGKRRIRQKAGYAAERSGMFDSAWMIDEQDVAGSIHRPRIADLVVTLNRNDAYDDNDAKVLEAMKQGKVTAETAKFALFLAKHRFAVSRRALFVSDTHFAYGTWLPIDAVGTDFRPWMGYAETIGV